ncbi:hypothetical protein H4R33_005329 [Dimargaris cristalligena]|nr:hypothetical protein H4R33_005329 [Dimargaris cristalligena]
MPLAKLTQWYEGFILNNAAQVSSIESTVRSLTYILPGRFSDADLASEALYTLLNFIGLYHDHVLHKAVGRALRSGRLSATLPDPPAINRYHRYFFEHGQKPSLYRQLSLILTLLQFSESLVEMVVRKKWGNKGKWRAVTLIELAKVACRLALINLSGKRMLLSPAYPDRELEPEAVGLLFEPAAPQPNLVDSGDSRSPGWRGSRTGLRYASISSIVDGSAGSNAGVTDYLRTKASRSESVVCPSDLVPRLTHRRLLGEYLFALRPILYVFAIRKWGRRAWLPWVISLAIESLSRLLSVSSSRKRSTGVSLGSSLELTELSRRLWLFLYYFLRSPFYERFTKPRLDRIIKRTQNKPLISLFTGILSDYQPLWESFYFYTAGS